tara:strand:+ start:280 stop:1008 length:729 start_codon:yes stop_codon:yes gene_type:complete
MKIAFLIPSTTKGTKAKKLEDTFLFKILIQSLIRTLSNEHKYTFYYALDDNDRLYSKLQTKKKILNKRYYGNLDITPVILSTKNIEKGNVVGYWNMLFERAYLDGNDYFVQCGDDIVFQNNNWLDMCVHNLNQSLNIGCCSPQDIRMPNLMTQSVVSRKHMEIFGYYYPPELTSWFCDNWITDVYGKSFSQFLPCGLENKGGAPRYTPPDWEITKKLCSDLVTRDKPKILNYINLLSQVVIH